MNQNCISHKSRKSDAGFHIPNIWTPESRHNFFITLVFVSALDYSQTSHLGIINRAWDRCKRAHCQKDQLQILRANGFEDCLFGDLLLTNRPQTGCSPSVFGDGNHLYRMDLIQASQPLLSHYLVSSFYQLS